VLNCRYLYNNIAFILYVLRGIWVGIVNHNLMKNEGGVNRICLECERWKWGTGNGGEFVNEVICLFVDGKEN